MNNINVYQLSVYGDRIWTIDWTSANGEQFVI